MALNRTTIVVMTIKLAIVRRHKFLQVDTLVEDKKVIEFREHSSVSLVRAQADDQMIADDARLSTDSKGGAGLVKALMRERHGTPFEAPQFTFQIEAPIFVAREAHRHRIASISEMSSRYVELLPVFWIPPVNRPLVQVGKAMDYKFQPGTEEQYLNTISALCDSYSLAWDVYQKLITQGVAKEVARVVLPVAVFTKWRLRINLRSALNVLALRTRDERATYPSKPQLEIVEVARQMEKIIEEYCPISMEAFNAGGRVAP